MDNERRQDGWMWTYTGRKYWPADPRVEDVNIHDIARGLSMLCRYTGHTKWFYSVAEHSVLVSLMVPQELALEALLHDASEAYLGDVSRPLKHHLPDYQRLEELNTRVIRERFMLPPTEHRLVKAADSNILHTEMKTLCVPLPPGTSIPGTYDPQCQIFCWYPEHAEIAFINRFNALITQQAIRNS